MHVNKHHFIQASCAYESKFSAYANSCPQTRWLMRWHKSVLVFFGSTRLQPDWVFVYFQRSTIDSVLLRSTAHRIPFSTTKNYKIDDARKGSSPWHTPHLPAPVITDCGQHLFSRMQSKSVKGTKRCVKAWNQKFKHKNSNTANEERYQRLLFGWGLLKKH